jgi:hypothetical protein
MHARLTCAHWILAIGLCIAGVGTTQATLPTGISGPWYNPAQSGHGLSIEILAQNSALVFWYVYDPQGNPVHLYIEGRIVGRRIEGTAYAPRGMRFGEFNPADRELPRWGSVNIDFSDCTHATLQWNALSSAYGSGQMPIRQLTGLADLPCELPALNRLPTGLYEGVLEVSDPAVQTSAWGFVDRESKLWAIQRWHWTQPAFPNDPGIHQGLYGLNRGQYVFTAKLDNSGGAEPLSATMRILSNGWQPPAGIVDQASGQWNTSAGTTTAEFTARPQSYNSITRHRWRQGAATGFELIAPVSIAQLRQVYRLDYYEGELVPPRRGEIQVDEFGGVCVRVYADTCDLIGKLETPDGDLGLIHFELRSTIDRELPAYRGRGWLIQQTGGPRVLTLTGDNGSFGVGLVGRAVP